MHGDRRSDAQLLRAASKDPEAFGVFYDRHAAAVLSYYVRRTVDPALAADLTSETFAEAFASRRRFRDTGAPARAWLFTIARRQLNELFRRERVSRKYRSKLGVAEAVGVDGGFDRVDELDSLQAQIAALNGALDRLGPTLAEAVRRRVSDEWSYEQVAAHLGCSVGAARVRVSRALDQLSNDKGIR